MVKRLNGRVDGDVIRITDECESEFLNTVLRAKNL